MFRIETTLISIIGIAAICPTAALGDEVTFNGLVHTSLGSAQLSLQNDGTELVVSNLGSSGLDGVSIALDSNATSWDAEFLPIDPLENAPVGALMRSVSIGTIGGVPDQEFAEVVVEKSQSDRHAVHIAFPNLGSYSTETLQVFRDGEMFFSQTYAHGPEPDAKVCVDWELCWPLDWHKKKGFPWFRITFKKLLKNGKTVQHVDPFTVLNFEEMDEFRIVPNFDSPPPEVEEFTAVQLFGTDIDSFTFVLPEPVPTASAWGLIAMMVLVLTAGTVVLGRRRKFLAA